MRRWLYYHRLALQDLVRLWSTTQQHVVIVVGICLPILLLMGLKQGHVAELRKDLVTSPTGRQVVFWSAQQGELMDLAAVDRLESELPGVERVIPEIKRVVILSAGSGPEARAVENLTLHATRRGDPILGQVGGDVLAPGEQGAVLSRPVAEALRVAPGDEVTLTALRQSGAGVESAETRLGVKAVVDLGPAGGSGQVAFGDVQLLDRLERYVLGHRVAEYGWPARGQEAATTCSSYLLFCESGSDLTAADRDFLGEMGLRASPVGPEGLPELARLLRSDRLPGLRIYRLTGVASEGRPAARLGRAPEQISDATEADDVVLPWDPPREVRAAGGDRRTLIGLSLVRRTWLRGYFLRPDLPLGVDAPTLSFRAAGGDVPDELAFPGPGGHTIRLARAEAPESPGEAGDAPAPADLVVVPTQLLGYLAGAEAGAVEFDPSVGRFVAVPEPPVYGRARLFARTIDDVPTVVDALQKRRFVVEASHARITEIHNQDRSLQLLVAIVGCGVFLFGVIVVVSVLLDSTDRKRGTIGILRVMGVSRAGIFYLVLLRAMAIGLIAGAVSLGAGYLITAALGWVPPAGSAWADWKPVVRLIIRPDAVALITGGALLCCAVGSLIPALWASRIDPFDAIVEGRFR